MSKKSKRDRDKGREYNDYNYSSPQNNNNDIATLMNMLQNVDTNQLMALITQMNANKQQSANNENMNIQNSNQAQSTDATQNLLNSLKPFLPPEKIAIVEQLMANMNKK